MSFISWLRDKLGTAPVPLSGADITTYGEEYQALIGDIYIRELAFWSAVNFVANAISKCEFKTFKAGKEVKGPEYYLWNIEPNKNQNSSVFIQQLISTAFCGNEALVIEQNGQLLVADSFKRDPYALYEDVFTQVQVGDFKFGRSFVQSDVLYFKLHSKDMRKVVNGLYSAYAKLITYSITAYQKSRGTKGIFTYDALPVAGTEQRTLFDKLVTEKFKTFMASGDAILPLGKGQSFTDIGSKTYASESTRDIRALINDVSDFTAKGFGIPPVLLRGDVQDTKAAIDDFLTFCVDPLVDMISEEINRKRYGRSQYLAGNYIQIDTSTIKHVDLFDKATSIDKLISSGAFCINDIRLACGKPAILESWAEQHFMTKNYATVADVLAALGEGGGDDG